MFVFDANIADGSAGYDVGNAVICDGSSHFSRTATTNANHSGSIWFKLSGLGSQRNLFGTGIYLSSGDALVVNGLTSTALLRDTTAWYHLFWNNTGAWLNGVAVTGTGTYATAVLINPSIAGPTNFFDGSLAYFAFGDAQSWTYTDTGELDTNGVWRPKRVSGLTLGTEGFLLDFSNSAALGDDAVGSNNWAVNGFVSTDQVLDTPGPGTDQNYCLWSTLNNKSATITEGGSTASVTAGNWACCAFGATDGSKVHFEFSVTATGSQAEIGIVDLSSISHNGSLASVLPVAALYLSDGRKRILDAAASAYGATYTGGDRIAVEYDPTGGTVEFFKNGVSQGSISLTLTGGTWAPFITSQGTTTTVMLNSGQFGLTDTPTTGFTSLQTANLPEPTIPDGSAHFKAITYTGNGTAIGSGGLSVTGCEDSQGTTWTPDFVWIKNRDAADSHMLFDVSRGVTKYIKSDANSAEVTDAETLTSFDDGGFTVGNNVAVNTLNENYIAWCWKMGGAASSNTNGSLTSQVSVNATAGQVVGTYTAAGANATVGHGLSQAPEVILIKKRDSANNWNVYHVGVGNTGRLFLDLSNAVNTAGVWQNTDPTSTVFSIKPSFTDVDGSCVFYAFHSVPGYSKIGSYTGNGSADGPYVDCGFPPRFIMFKNATTAGTPWHMFDTERTPNNPTGTTLNADSAAAEATAASFDIDIVGGGFKVRNAGGDLNASGSTVTYMAFAEHPFGGANVTPTTGR